MHIDNDNQETTMTIIIMTRKCEFTIDFRVYMITLIFQLKKGKKNYF
jgi:hypothetical protein